MFSSVQAEINDRDWYLEDTATGLYWLDLAESNSYYSQDVIAHTGAGGRYEGWRYATETEWETLVLNFGIVPHSKECDYSIFCHKWGIEGRSPSGVRRMVDLLGANVNAYLDSRTYSGDFGPTSNGDRISSGLYAREYSDGSSDCCFDSRIRDDASFTSVGGNQVWFTTVERDQADGSYLVRDTVPAQRPSRPEAPVLNIIDFEDVLPADLNVQFLCDGAAEDGVGRGACLGHYLETRDTQTQMLLAVPDDFDRQRTPWMRVVRYDVRMHYFGGIVLERHPDCSALDGMYVEGVGGRQYIESAEPAPQNVAGVPTHGYWCRVSFASNWEYLPNLQPDSQVPGVIPVVAIGTDALWTEDGSEYFTWIDWSYDNIVVETISGNVDADFDPWSQQNLIYPDSSYEINIGINTTRMADGDAFDFAAADIDVDTVRAGPDEASLVAAPLVIDLNGDGDLDYLLKFEMVDTGVACADTSISITGQTVDGAPFIGEDTIVPTNCEVGGCHP